MAMASLKQKPDGKPVVNPELTRRHGRRVFQALRVLRE